MLLHIIKSLFSWGSEIEEAIRRNDEKEAEGNHFEALFAFGDVFWLVSCDYLKKGVSLKQYGFFLIMSTWP